jgi:predicted lipid-binding transport protein (Tim44 family)
MKRLVALAVWLIVVVMPFSAWSRGGGGCIEQGTSVWTPFGAVPIETLQPGDTVWSLTDGRMETAAVLAFHRVDPDRYLEIIAGRSRLRVTDEHPIMVGPGEFRMARYLHENDVIYVADQGTLDAVKIDAIHIVSSELPAFNLLVSPGGTFAANGVMVHNKGCFLPETPVLRSDGSEISISKVSKGDELIAFTPDGRIVISRVIEVIRHQVDVYRVLRTASATLRVTPEHPFYVGAGTYKTVEALQPGDTVYAWNGEMLSEQRIVSMETVNETLPVFNLQTDHPNTFLAGGLAVHNKGGGCFPAGTRIETPLGQVPIESLVRGDAILTIDASGFPVETHVEEILVSRNTVWRIETDHGTLHTTPEHPIALEDGNFCEASRLRPGEFIRRWENGRLSLVEILNSHTTSEQTLVINLRVGEPHTFIADGILVHNKGGGGGGSRSSSRSGRSSGSGGSQEEAPWWVVLIFLVVFAGFFIFIIVAIIKTFTGGKIKSEELDFRYSRSQIDRKAKKTEKLFQFISAQDPDMRSDALKKMVESTFRKLQECWQARDYSPMKPLLMPALYAQHNAQIQSMIRNNEINHIDNLTVERIDLVNIRYTEKADQREFSALISASAKDYYTSNTGAFLRGDRAPARFQEFWTFQRFEDRWVLREIEQAGESDILKEENFVAMLTDENIQNVYAEVAKDGTDAAWVDKKEAEKATRIDRLLNFLVQTDKLWNRRLMLERARQVFMSVYLARETGDSQQIPAEDLFPDVAQSLDADMQRWRAEGMRTEYRNLCVRKAELIHVRNFTDPNLDEYTVRIDAHAQQFVRKGEQTVKEQPYVTPFEEFWTFGRRDSQWKLKEVVSVSQAQKMIGTENIDEDSNTGQLNWYYRQTRAN